MKKFKHIIQEALAKLPGTQMGSNDGGIHVDTETGEKHYVKYYKNPDQAKTEELTSKLYGLMGLHTLNPKYEQHDDKHAISTKYNENLERMKPHHFENLDGKQREQIATMYHAAVLTKNWDVVGLEHDNIMRHKETGDLHSIDTGGAFNFRAQGGHKDYGPDIAEHKSLLNSSNYSSSHVFGHVFQQDPHVEYKALDRVKNLDHNAVKNAFETSGIHNWPELHSNFMQRKEALLKHYEG